MSKAQLAIAALIVGTMLPINTATSITKASAPTLEVALATSEEPVPIRYEEVRAEVSAYTSDPGETDEDPLTMASGKKVYAGAAACPSRYPFGTRIEVEGSRYTCEDRMNARYRSGNYFDLWVETKAEAYQWGRRTIQVRIINTP